MSQEHGSEIKIELIKGKDFHQDLELVKKIQSIIQETYVDPLPILMRELSICTDLYLATQGDSIVGFSMVSKEEDLQIKSKTFACVYLGLGATSEKFRQSGSGKRIFDQIISDAQVWEKENKKNVLFWFTTLNPIVSHTIHACFANPEPTLEGGYTKEGAEIVCEIVRREGWEKFQDPNHPFILQKIVQDARYSEAERKKIEKANQHRKISLFSDLHLDETQGDRMLYICYPPKK